MAENTSGSFWMPPQASTVASDVDGLFDFILWLNVIFFALIAGAVIWFVIKHRRRSADQLSESQVGHNTMLEATWTFVPTVLVIVLFVWGFRLFLDLNVVPAGAYEVQVKGEKWKWTFTYPNGTSTVNELYAPAGQPVKLIISSKDVLHSFFVPDFRIKMDAVPGRYTTAWFQADSPANHQIYCTEYCGTGHSAMLAEVKVLSAEDWKKAQDEGWPSQKGGDRDPAEWGKELYTKLTCNACHTLDGTRTVGPSFKGLFGKEEKLVGGATAKVDENYLRESILDPAAKVVDTYPPAMPAFQGQVSDAQVDALIAFIKAQK